MSKQKNNLIEFSNKGLYCPRGKFYIDPFKPVDRALITHAHGDHARWGMKYYLSHHDSIPIMKVRIGEYNHYEGIGFDESMEINGVKVSFHPAGHIIGSAQIRLEYKGEVWVVSGDYKLENDGLSPAYEPVQCNAFITESTVYPGCTEEDCVPILEEKSGLKFKDDFYVGYSPERINPGDREHTLTKITKVVSGCCNGSLDTIANVYSSIIEAGVHKAASIKVAEAAKVIENTQRDLNIALMNELSIIFNKMNINTFDVLEAAGTKWNFLKFIPGLVGGHCIGVDPYYLTYKSSEIGYHSKVILAGRQTNDSMGAYVAKETVKLLIDKNKPLKECNVLVLGATFKENVADIRNSKVADVIKELKSFSLNVDVVDPHASNEEFHEEYGIHLTDKMKDKYDAVIITVPHNEYVDLNEDYFKKLTGNEGVIIDLKGIFKKKIQDLTYWSL